MKSDTSFLSDTMVVQTVTVNFNKAQHAIIITLDDCVLSFTPQSITYLYNLVYKKQRCPKINLIALSRR